MKHFLYAVVSTMLACTVCVACSNRRAAIDRMVDELNSPSFRASEAKTGLFDDSKAEIDGDSLEIWFLCRPFVNLNSISPDDLPELHKTTVAEFKGYLSNPDFKTGIEALRNENMVLLMVWKDANGTELKMPIKPAEILDAN